MMLGVAAASSVTFAETTTPTNRPPRVQAAPPTELQMELQPIVTAIKDKLKEGKKTEADLAENLAAIDALIAKHKQDTNDAAAGLYFLKVQIYSGVLDDDAKAAALLNQVKKDFAGTKVAKSAEAQLEMIKEQEASKAIQRALAPGKQFPDFAEKDLADKPLSIARFKGKVVLVDFWATWCGPCRAELPNVLKVYQEQHKNGFEVVGISLDSDREKLDKFIADKGVPWPQFFDGAGWKNKLGQKYGVNSIPATYLLDREGKIIAKGLRGEALAEAVAKALAAK